jgi:phospholipase A2
MYGTWVYVYLMSLISGVAGITGLGTDSITIHNKSREHLYCAVYYDNERASGSGSEITAQRATKIYEVSAGDTLTFVRPPRKIVEWPAYYDRVLFFTNNPQDLKEELAAPALYLTPAVHVGAGNGASFYLRRTDGDLRGYTSVEWLAQELIFDNIDQAEERLLEQAREREPAIISNPYRNQDAQVRVGNELPWQEKVALVNRQKVVQQTLEQVSGSLLEGKHIPKIALVTSGGGYRAMMMTLGCMVGAQKAGILDACTWVSTLSGSCWAVGPWISSGKSLEEFRAQLFGSLAGHGLEDFSNKELKLLINYLMVPCVFKQPITPTDLFGGLLATRLLSWAGDARHQVYLSQQAALVESGRVAIPIYTAVRADIGVADGSVDQEWYEYTPWEVGSAWLGMYVPTWAFGRSFYNGVSVDRAVEKPLGYHMGTMGSAFGADLATIYDQLVAGLKTKTKKIELQDFIGNQIINKLASDRIAWAQLHNFTRGMQDSPVNHVHSLRLVDAGLAGNLPYPPVSGERAERMPDMLLFFDFSQDIAGGVSLRDAEKYARENGLKFPVIDYAQIDKRAISVFRDDTDLEVPVVVYMPRTRDERVMGYLKKPAYADYKKLLENFDVQACINDGTCDMFNFNYSRNKMDQLSGFAEFTIQVLAPAIIHEIMGIIERKS